MTRLAEITQGIVAVTLIAAAFFLRYKGIPGDGFDAAVPVIVAVYIGGKVVQTVQSGQSGASGAVTGATTAGPGAGVSNAAHGASASAPTPAPPADTAPLPNAVL